MPFPRLVCLVPSLFVCLEGPLVQESSRPLAPSNYSSADYVARAREGYKCEPRGNRPEDLEEQGQLCTITREKEMNRSSTTAVGHRSRCVRSCERIMTDRFQQHK